ncbi:hypothetical protein BDD12DRAFT_826924 [Trichophaea hybrida]|nr:hypothetical protein BDD12DRAFT_826924 [Trichophaea hybrida]
MPRAPKSTTTTRSARSSTTRGTRGTTTTQATTTTTTRARRSTRATTTSTTTRTRRSTRATTTTATTTTTITPPTPPPTPRPSLIVRIPICESTLSCWMQVLKLRSMLLEQNEMTRAARILCAVFTADTGVPAEKKGEEEEEVEQTEYWWFIEKLSEQMEKCAECPRCGELVRKEEAEGRWTRFLGTNDP